MNNILGEDIRVRDLISLLAASESNCRIRKIRILEGVRYLTRHELYPCLNYTINDITIDPDGIMCLEIVDDYAEDNELTNRERKFAKSLKEELSKEEIDNNCIDLDTLADEYDTMFRYSEPEHESAKGDFFRDDMEVEYE